MLNLHTLPGRAGRGIARTPRPIRRKAEAIPLRHAAKALAAGAVWVFAECLDTPRAKNAAPRTGMPTIYHSSEFGAASPLQVYQMVHWADHNLPNNVTPGGGKAVWNCNWAPNNAEPTPTRPTSWPSRSNSIWPWPTTWPAGSDDALRAAARRAVSACITELHPAAWAVTCASTSAASKMPSFPTAISMFGRAVLEGLYGIRPRRHRWHGELSPQFPEGWSDTSIETSHFSYRGRRMSIKS